MKLILTIFITTCLSSAFAQTKKPAAPEMHDKEHHHKGKPDHKHDDEHHKKHDHKSHHPEHDPAKAVGDDEHTEEKK
ncbi:MAG: hypothetical protein K2P81_15830 [Bacteriovoracaceae bacterium]|nr:hypothetical protein [Bacteriovoracaceae bacterium]